MVFWPTAIFPVSISRILRKAVRSLSAHRGAIFSLANFMRVNLYTALGALKTGLDILSSKEGVEVDKILGHGGLFKTPGVDKRSWQRP